MRRRTQLIRERSALTRQVINFFQMHLLGSYRWDEAIVLPAMPIPRPVYEIGLTRDEREARRDDRKVHDMVAVKFGPFELIAKGPYEDAQHPCGLIRASRGEKFVEGPLDEATWKMVADFIKQKEENDEHARSPQQHEPHAAPGPDADISARAPWGC